MSLELLDACETDEGIAVTFATERGLERLEGSADEIAHLARAMQQVAALGQLNEHEQRVGGGGFGRTVGGQAGAEPGRSGAGADLATTPQQDQEA